MTWFAFTAAGGTQACFEPATMATVGVVGLIAAVTAGFRKYGLDSRTTIDGIRKRTFDVVEAKYGTLAEQFALKDADRALAENLDKCFLDRDALVKATRDPKGFPTCATEMVMGELAVKCPDAFGEAGPLIGKEYARLVIGASLEAAVTTPEYFQKLQPKLELLQLQSLTEIIESNGRIEAKVDAGFAAVLASIDDLKRQRLALSERQVIHLLEEFELGGVPVDQAEERLLKSAEELKSLRARLSKLSNEDEPEIAAKLQLAKEAIDAADFAKADRLLAEAEDADMAAGERRIRRAAETMADRGALARSQAKFEDAAAHYGRAAATVAPYDAEKAWEWHFAQADVLDDHAQLFPGLDSLRQAIAVLRDKCLPHSPREKRAAGWAIIQNTLGIALSRLGVRAGGEAGLTALNEAVAAFRAALEVQPCETMPLDWAMTQNNLGNVLRNLGDRARGESGLAALNEAVAAFRAALEVYTRETMPVDWAMTQNNLGNALQSLGDRAGGEAGLATLNEAVAAYRAALEVYTLDTMPVDWAMTQNNLGNALQSLEDRAGGEAGLAALNEAVAAFRSALEVYTRDTMPVDWAMTQNSLGNALQSLGARAGGEAELAALNEAVAAYRAALEVYTRDTMPAQWAMTQNNLGNALQCLGDRADGEAGLATLNEAVAASRAALEVFTRETMPADWALTTENLALTEVSIAAGSGDPGMLRQAMSRMDEVIAIYESMQAGFYIEKAKRNQNWMRAALTKMSSTSSHH